jgi:hypothetical protein
MGATGVDDHVATGELRVFLDPVAGSRQLFLGMLAKQRHIVRVEVDHGLMRGQLRQRRTYGPEDHFRLHRDRLADDFARDFRPAALAAFVGDTGIEAGLFRQFARRVVSRPAGPRPSVPLSNPPGSPPGVLTQDGDCGSPRSDFARLLHAVLRADAIGIAKIGQSRLPCLVPGFGWWGEICVFRLSRGSPSGALPQGVRPMPPLRGIVAKELHLFIRVLRQTAGNT